MACIARQMEQDQASVVFVETHLQESWNFADPTVWTLTLQDAEHVMPSFA